MESDFHSQLKRFKIQRGEGGTLNITCPQRDCGGKFVVSASWRRGGGGWGTGPCPYCFKTAFRR